MKATNFRKFWMFLGLLTVLVGLLGFATQPVSAQTGEGDLTLNINKVIGYSWQAEIRGTFRMTALGPEDLRSVTFFIDGQPIGEIAQPPFEIRFVTTDFSVGEHQLSARGTTRDGRELVSKTRTFNFVSNTQQGASMPRALTPLFVILGGIAVVVFVAQFIAFRPGRRKIIPLGAPRSYGVTGGAVCPKCNRPVALHWWGLKLVPTVRLDRCEHCGRWSAMRRASRETLAQAERNELEMAGPAVPVAEKSEAEQLQEQLDRSKYVE